MTYCFFSAQYLPTVGGVERYTHELARQLAARGHRVKIVTSLLVGQQEHEKEAPGIEVVRVPSLSLLGGRMPVAHPLAWKRLARVLENAAIDRIVVQTRLYPLCLLGMRFARDHRIPFLTIEHGSGYIGMASPILSLADRCYENYVLWRAGRLCHSFYAVSQASAGWLATRGIQAKGVLYNSVDHRAIEAVVRTAQGTVEDNLPEETQFILYAGRLIPEKGILQLVEAVCALSARCPVCLLVAGDGPLRQELERRETPSVRLLGELPRDELLALMARSALLCLPSDSEGFPTIVLEAVVCGCYVVTAPYGGAKELIAGPEYGTVMHDNSSEEILRAISWALEHPEECRRRAERARERFLQGFTWEHTCDALEQADFVKV